MNSVLEEDVTQIAGEALFVCLDAGVFAPFLCDLAQISSRNMTFSKIREPDIRLANRLEEHWRATGKSSFSGNFALLEFVLRLEKPAKLARRMDASEAMSGLGNGLSFQGLENKEIKNYSKLLSEYAVRVLATFDDYRELFLTLKSTDESKIILYEELLGQARKQYQKRGNVDCLIALNVFAATQHNPIFHKTCSRQLGRLKSELILGEIDPKTKNLIRHEFGRDSKYLRRWEKIVDSSVKKSNNSILSLLMG